MVDLDRGMRQNGFLPSMTQAANVRHIRGHFTENKNPYCDVGQTGQEKMGASPVKGSFFFGQASVGRPALRGSVSLGMLQSRVHQVDFRTQLFFDPGTDKRQVFGMVFHFHVHHFLVGL